MSSNLKGVSSLLNEGWRATCELKGETLSSVHKEPKRFACLFYPPHGGGARSAGRFLETGPGSLGLVGGPMDVSHKRVPGLSDSGLSGSRTWGKPRELW